MSDLPPPPGPSGPPPGPSGSWTGPYGSPPGPPPAPPIGYGPAPGAAGARTNGFAVASLVLGIVGLPACFFFVPATLAVIFGGVALSQIKQQPGLYTGRGMAIAGLVLGLVGLAGFALVLISGLVDYHHWND
jgi:hypothetical protein